LNIKLIQHLKHLPFLIDKKGLSRRLTRWPIAEICHEDYATVLHARHGHHSSEVAGAYDAKVQMEK
jgi:hypothetical protein